MSTNIDLIRGQASHILAHLQSDPGYRILLEQDPESILFTVDQSQEKQSAAPGTHALVSCEVITCLLTDPETCFVASLFPD